MATARLAMVMCVAILASSCGNGNSQAPPAATHDAASYFGELAGINLAQAKRADNLPTVGIPPTDDLFLRWLAQQTSAIQLYEEDVNETTPSNSAAGLHHDLQVHLAEHLDLAQLVLDRGTAAPDATAVAIAEEATLAQAKVRSDCQELSNLAEEEGYDVNLYCDDLLIAGEPGP